MVTAFGRTMPLQWWAHEYGISPRVIAKRLADGGWTSEQAVTCHRRAETNELWPGANRLRYEDDRMMQLVVNELAPLTLEQIGLILGYNRERIRQIERDALAKLREAMGDEEREVLLGIIAERNATESLWDELEQAL